MTDQKPNESEPRKDTQKDIPNQPRPNQGNEPKPPVR